MLVCLLISIIIIIVILLLLKFFFKYQHQDCRSKVCLIGKTALIIGGSDGIGYQIVLGLASRGCRVIIGDIKIDQAIRDTIVKETNNSSIILKYVNCASFKSVRKFAEELRNSEDKLDILIYNAGVGSGKSLRTEDDINLTMQVNFYSSFLLVHLLIDLLKKSPRGGRIIFTSSLLNFLHPITIKSVKKSGIEKGYELFAYPISKFCQVTTSIAFAKKLEKYGTTSNCFHPFAAKTNIFKNSLKDCSWLERIVVDLMQLLALVAGKTPEEAAQTGIYLACANEVNNISGEFFGDMKPTRKPPRADDERLREAIWKEAERVVHLRPELRLE